MCLLQESPLGAKKEKEEQKREEEGKRERRGQKGHSRKGVGKKKRRALGSRGKKVDNGFWDLPLLQERKSPHTLPSSFLFLARRVARLSSPSLRHMHFCFLSASKIFDTKSPRADSSLKTKKARVFLEDWWAAKKGKESPSRKLL